MTDILPPAGWPNVRQLETNEFASGGANGNMNEQAKSLAARSELLKQYAALPYESKTGGYALNERVQLATGDIVRSTIASNVNNPNVNMTGWEVPSLNPAENLSDVPDKAAARSNLSVYSQTEVDTAISNATPTIPNATETVAGKAKIATTAIAQAGTNDTDIITPLKLKNTIFGFGQNRKVVTKISGTTYTNTTGKPIGFEVIFKSTGSDFSVMDSNITVNSEIRQHLAIPAGDITYRCSMFVIILPNESYSFNAVRLSSIEKVTEIS